MRKAGKPLLDPERFEATYGEWEAMAEDALQNLRATGVNPGKVLVRPDKLEAWCQKHKKPNISASRSEFVTHLMREKHAG